MRVEAEVWDNPTPIPEGWTPMVEKEANQWCRKWSMQNDVGDFCKWTPTIEPSTPTLTKAVEIAWERIKQSRPPCLNGDGRPAIHFNSGPLVNLNESIWEHIGCVHNPNLPPIIKLVDYSKETLPYRGDHERELTLSADEVGWRLRGDNPEQELATMILNHLDFGVKGFREQPVRFCEDRFWVVEDRKAETGLKCPKCGERGTGYGTIGNQRRFYHERDRSCYLAGVENLQKRAELTECPKCGEPGQMNKGKDGHTRFRHGTKSCYINRVGIL
jgi:predicted RNA-binding Zn-ribbon protein involved in translation (DUF1610 family)